MQCSAAKCSAVSAVKDVQCRMCPTSTAARKGTINRVCDSSDTESRIKTGGQTRARQTSRNTAKLTCLSLKDPCVV